MIRELHTMQQVNAKRVLLVLVFALLCGVSLFADGLPLIDSDIESKWFGTLFLVFAMGALSALGGHSRTVTVRAMDWAVGLVLVWVVIRSIGHVTLLYYLRLAAVGVLYVGFRMAGRRYAKEAGLTVAVLTVVLAMYGLGQWLHVIPAGGRSFPVVGTFDNPAGFASALAMGVPFVLPFVKHERRGVQVAAVGALLLVLVVLAAAQSRAALLATLAVLVLWAASSSHRPVGTFWKVAVPVLLAAAFVGMYFLKKDSADGRLLIWWVTLRLIMQHPVVGGGTHAFWRAYMPAQADYFRLHPDSRFALLADNVRHPFNEYLSVLLQWGVVGLLLLAIVVLLAVRAWRSHRDSEKDTSLLALVALGIVACFSYPMNYPFAWIILTGGLATFGSATPAWRPRQFPSLVQTTIVTIVSTALLVTSAIQYHYYEEWHNVAHHRPAVAMEKLAETYERLLPHMKRDSFFLYNYAAELYYHKRVIAALSFINDSMRGQDDYLTEYLYANILLAMDDSKEAMGIFDTLSNMCPSLFVPVFKKFEISVRNNDKEKALYYAKDIVSKPIKKESQQVNHIRTCCVEYINNNNI